MGVSPLVPVEKEQTCVVPCWSPSKHLENPHQQHGNPSPKQLQAPLGRGAVHGRQQEAQGLARTGAGADHQIPSVADGLNHSVEWGEGGVRLQPNRQGPFHLSPKRLFLG